jgi:hypothetical protein
MRCAKSLSSRALAFSLCFLLLVAGIGSLAAQETESLPEQPPDTTSLSSTKESESQDLDALFQSLRDEINSWGTDSETLFNSLEGILTINDARSPYLTLLREQYDGLSEGEKEMVRAFLASNILEVRAREKAEREARLWKGLGIAGLSIGAVGGLAAWYGLTH